MKEDLSSKIANWLISFSSFEEFEISNKNLNRLIWRRQKRLLIVGLISIFLLILMDSIQIQSAEWAGRGRMRIIASVISEALMIIAMLGHWIQILLKRRKLFVTYPELEHELANLIDADYVDEALQAYIYGHHLVIITAGGLDILHLDHCQFLEIENKILSNDLAVYYVLVTLYDDKQVKVKVPNYPSVDTGQRLEELQEYIETNF